MVNYKCNLCDYETDRKSNIDRHTKSHAFREKMARENVTVCPSCNMNFVNKYVCRRHMLLYCDKTQNNNILDPSSSKNNVLEENNNIFQENNNTSEQNNNILNHLIDENDKPFKCKNCYKSFTVKSNLTRHLAICPEISHPFQCKKCRKILSCQQSKSRHQKSCKVYNPALDADNTFSGNVARSNPTSSSLIHVDTNHGNIQVNNTYYIHNQTVQNVTVNFGQERVDHITNETKDAWLKMLHGSGVIKAIEEVHFNPNVPENHNIKLDGSSRKILKVFQNDRWNRRATSEITEILISNGKRMLMERYMDSPVRQEDSGTRLIYQDILTTDKIARPDVYYKIVNQIIAKMIDITEEIISEEPSA